MALPKQKTLSRAEFLDLLDDEDIRALWTLWNLPSADAISREAPHFLAAINKRSQTSLLEDALSLTTPTLHMLRDILTFLEGHHAALRTTGSLLVLDEEFDIAPQQVDAALKWSPKKLERQSAQTWEGVEKQFYEEIIPLYQKIEAHGEVQIEEDEEDDVTTYMRAMTAGDPYAETTIIASFDLEGFRTRGEYVSNLQTLKEKIAPIYNLDIVPPAQRMISAIQALHREEQGRFDQDQCDIQRADKFHYQSSSIKLMKDDHQTWKRFSETVLFLAEIEENNTLVDVLRMDLFRNRPQLYEIWTVVAILRFMLRAGYRVEMLSLRTTDIGRIVWNLNYSKSQVPIARLSRRSDSRVFFILSAVPSRQEAGRHARYRPNAERTTRRQACVDHGSEALGASQLLADRLREGRGALSQDV